MARQMLYSFAFVAFRRCMLNRQQASRSLIRQFRKFKKPQPVVYLAFLGISFSKKEVEEEKKIATTVTMSDLKEDLEKADALFDDNKFEETIKFLETLNQDSAEVQWRLGRAIFKASGTSSGSTKNDQIKIAYNHVLEALQKDENNFAIHKWYAILLDAKSNIDGIKARITQLETVKTHMIKAIELNPTDSTSRYILGEFYFGLADLSWYQKKIVETIFAKPPDSSYEMALEHFLKAEELKEDFYSMNKLMIGKCYLAMKDNEKAKEYLQKAASITVQNEDDRKCKEEATKLLSKVK